MTTKVVVFDIGDVLEVNPATGWPRRWEARLGLPAGEVARRLHEVTAAGAIGAMQCGDTVLGIENGKAAETIGPAVFTVLLAVAAIWL